MLDNHAIKFGEFGAFYIYHEQIVLAFDAIKELSKNELWALYSFEAMLENSIYPVMVDEDKDPFFDYIYSYFELIRSFYNQAAANNKGIIFYIM